MSKLYCKCGGIMYDNTDQIHNKARIFSPDDISNPRRVFLRVCFQCDDCGRLYVENEDQYSFRSYSSEVLAPNLLSSSRGEQWRASMRAEWQEPKLPYRQCKGMLCIEAADDVWQEYDDYTELERDYYARFNQLRERGLLRYAMLRKEGQQIHQWLYEDKPAQVMPTDEVIKKLIAKFGFRQSELSSPSQAARSELRARKMHDLISLGVFLTGCLLFVLIFAFFYPNTKNMPPDRPSLADEQCQQHCLANGQMGMVVDQLYHIPTATGSTTGSWSKCTCVTGKAIP